MAHEAEARVILVFGSINVDLVARVAAIAQPGETVLSHSADTRFGGKGANQAVAAARALHDRAIGVRMAGAVGTDGFGTAARDNLLQQGVDVAGVRDSALSTGWACIAVTPAGENAITVASGANRDVIAAQVPDAWLGPDTLLVLQMEVPPAESLALARRVKARGGRVLLNLAPAPDDLPQDTAEALLQAADILVVNQHEADVVMHRFAAGSMAPLATRYGCAVVITSGAAGAQALMPDGAQHRAAALPVQPVDTTGAGDTFVGVLAASLAEGMAFEAGLRRAAAAGSLACLALGAQAAMPRAADLDAAVGR
jgi:ribokinase